MYIFYDILLFIHTKVYTYIYKVINALIHEFRHMYLEIHI